MPLPRFFAILLLLVALAWLGLGRLGGADALPALLPWATDRAAIADPGTPRPDGDANAGRLAAALDAAAAQADELARLGEAKSRNLLEIERGRRRMTDALNAADALIARGDLPPSARPAVAAYQEGAATVRAAMTDAQQGFLAFDWERVARASGEMRAGAEALDRAARLAAGE